MTPAAAPLLVVPGQAQHRAVQLANQVRGTDRLHGIPILDNPPSHPERRQCEASTAMVVTHPDEPYPEEEAVCGSGIPRSPNEATIAVIVVPPQQQQQHGIPLRLKNGSPGMIEIRMERILLVW